jgi:flagellar biosynthesis component FlhA
MKNVVSKLTKQMKTFKLKSLLQNKYVLYILVLVSLLNILDLANKKDFNSVIVFVIVGFLVSFFNKNMIVILLCALVFTHVLKYVNKVVRKEGMENEKKEKKEGMENEKKDEEKENEDDEEAMNNKDSDKKDLTEEEETMAKKKETYDMLKKDFDEFQDIQKNILENMKEIDPLLEKAENFITKFEHYKKGK